MLLYFALFLVFLLLTLRWMKRKDQHLNGKPIPTHPGLPIVGSGLEMDESDMVYKFEELAKRYGDIFSVNIFGSTTVVFNSESLMRDAYCSDRFSKYFNDKPNYFYNKYFRPSGDSVAFATNGNDSLYKKLKKIYIKALHTKGSGVKELEDKIMMELENFRSIIDTMETKEFDFSALVSRSLAKTVSIILFDELIPEGDPSEYLFQEKGVVVDFFISQYADIVMSFMPALRLLPFTRFGKAFRNGVNIDKQIIDKYIQTAKKNHQEGDSEGVLNFYLEEQRKQRLKGKDALLTDDRIASQQLETIDAGMITTSSQMSNTMLILLNHPECQVKIQEEIDCVISQSRMPTITDRAKCPYIRAFEMEVHRYIPVVPLIDPHVCNDNIEFNGYTIKKNSMIVPNIWFLHHDERIWGDPWNFRPERFLDENGDLLQPEHRLYRSVMPFGLGERQCVGQAFSKTQYFLYLVTLLQHYSFEAPEGCKLRSCDPRNKEDFEIKNTMRPKPFMVRAVERDSF